MDIGAGHARVSRLDYAAVAAALAVATLVRLALDPLFGDSFSYFTYVVATAVVAGYGRTRTAVLTLVGGGILAFYLFVPPRYSVVTTDANALAGLALYLFVGAVVVAMSRAMRAARNRAEGLLAEVVVQRNELRRAAETLAEQTERLRTTLASIGDAVISTDRDGNVTFLNAVAEVLTGWTSEEAAGVPLTRVFRIVNESTRLPVENPAMRALTEGVIVGLANHTILIARDGAERPIDDSAAPIRCRDGEIVGCVLVFRDIGEKKRLETERQEAQERVAATLESITDAFTRFDRDWRIVQVNSEAERLTGLRRSELLGKNHWDAFPTTVGTPLELEYRRAVAERVTIEFEHYFPPLGRWFAVKGDPTPDGGLAVFFRDITDRKAAEEVLRRSEARFRAGIEAVSSIVWTNDAGGMMVGEQSGWGAFTGQDRESYQGYGWSGAVHPDDAQPTIDAWNEAVAGKKTFEFEHRVRRYDGEWRRCSIRAVPILDAGGEIGEWVGVHTDITDQKRAEEEIARLAAESERQRRVYETILTNTPDFMYVFSLDHKVLYANDALIKMWGRGYDGAIGKTFLEIGYEPWHAEMHDREIDRVRATQQPIRGEVPFTGTLGRRQYDYIFVPILGADGAVEAVAGTTRDVTERKETERQLRDRQEQLDFALAAADLGQWSLNLADRTARRTLRHDQLFGYDALLPAWTYEMFLEHVVPDDRAAVDADFQKAVATGSAWAVECRIRRADGAVRHIWTKALIRQDSGGRVEWMLGIVGDVTDRRQAEERLRAGEERLRMALSAARMVAWEYDSATGAVATSDNAAEVYGFPPGEGMGNIDRGFAILHPEDVDRHRAAVAAAVAAGEGFTSQFRIVRPDTGAVQWMEERGHAVREGAGATVRLVGVNMDITARKRAEETLRESEERSAFVLRSSGVGFWYCDLPFDVLQWDELVKAHFHLPPDARVTIRTFYDRLHPDDREPTRQAIERSIGDRTPYGVDYRTVDPDTGAEKWVRAIGRTFYAADGTPTRFDGVTLDVSEQKRTEEQLRRLAADLSDADRRKDEFLATLAHELRNPLAPIRNGLEVIKLAGANGSVEQARAMMERQLTQMVRLVDDLLDISRVTQGKLELRRERVEVRAVIDAAVETAGPMIERAGHALAVAVPSEPIFLDGDATRLAQVVSNLLTNSAKYTHRGGNIRLEARRDGETVALSVADDGIGIPPDMLEKVFVMFTQVDRAIEKTTGGLGIGLSLIKGLVEMHGGSIAARSEGEGLGSEFVVRLPVAAEAPPPASGTEVIVSMPRSALRILVVDDNRDSAESLGMMLELMGHDIRTAYDGQEGVDAADEFRPDVALFDIGLPKLNGYEACRRIRGRPWAKGLKLIALTGWGQEDDRRRSADAGFDHHLVKPVDPQTVLKLLAGLPAGK